MRQAWVGDGRRGARARACALVVASGVALAALTACTAGPPGPEATAEALADALMRGDLSVVPLADATSAEATAQLEAAVAGVAPLHPAVQVAEVTVDEDDETAATATLQTRWDVDAGPTDWTYTTTARLSLVDDAWQAHWSPFLIAPDLRATETLGVRRVTAERAPVLGAGGAATLVEPRDVQRLGLDKMNLDPGQHDASARAIAELLGLDPQGYADRVASAGPKAFVEALVVRAAEPGVDLAAFAAIPGALSVPDTLPLAPTRTFARAILGTAGPATAEIVEESDGQVVAGDIAGLSGLQRQYDEQLRGRPGLTIVATASDTGAERELFHVEPTAGEPLVTTLLPEWQNAAEAVLAGVGPASGLVAMRASTGEVLAAASGPGSEGYSTATLATYAPGSVFKVVSSLAALRSGLTPDSRVQCPPQITVDGRTFTNFPGYPAAANGEIDLRTAVAHSCNTAFIGLGDQVSQGALVDAAASLGLGVEQSLGFPAFLGAVPAEADGTDHAASMIGQGRIQASPLAMATVAASVASGRTVVPWLVGSAAPEATGPTTPLSPDEAEALRGMMRAVVTDGGAPFLRDEPGPEVLAKTGTAEVGSGDDRHNHAWMIAIQGDLAVALVVENGDYGSTTAGPLLEQFLAATRG